LQVNESGQIDLTLSAPADLSGKHVIVRNPDGAQVGFVSSLQGVIINKSNLEQLSESIWQPIFPQQTYTAFGFTPSFPDGAVAFRESEP